MQSSRFSNTRPPRGGRGRRTAGAQDAFALGMKYAEELGMTPSKNFVPRRETGKRKPFGARPMGGARGRSFGGNTRGDFRAPTRSKRNAQEMQVPVSKLINKAKAADVEVYTSTHAFTDFAIDPKLKENIIAKGYLTPTPIQDQSIPHILKGKDVVGLANTGTGKTAAFLVPLIDKILKFRALGKNERVLVMVPTRELALQIENELFGFAKGLNLSSVTIVGGANISPQIRVLRRNPAFVIGTPGRLKDVMERKELDLSQFGTVVLDEADRMLDMGFIADMRFIMNKMQRERHTLFFSATMDKDIEKLIGEFLKDPVHISVRTRDTAETIDQDVVYVTRDNKFEKLVEVLSQKGMDKVLVFGRTKHGVERLARDLVRAGVPSESIHGDKTHGSRQKALTLFKRDHVRVLVATDVAARGLDITGVSHVINFDLPASYEDYTHRIGRTGRAGKAGSALTFILQ